MTKGNAKRHRQKADNNKPSSVGLGRTGVPYMVWYLLKGLSPTPYGLGFDITGWPQAAVGPPMVRERNRNDQFHTTRHTTPKPDRYP